MGLIYFSNTICVKNERELQKLVGDLFCQFIARVLSISSSKSRVRCPFTRLIILPNSCKSKVRKKKINVL